MPRTCTVCHHPDRAAIDAALVGGEPYRHIAERTGTSTTALQRHKAEHVPSHLAKAREAEVIADSGDLLGQVQDLRAKALDLLNKAEVAGDFRTALAGVREARACIELLLEVEGELDRRDQVNIMVLPEWVMIRGALLAALSPYPEALQSVTTALQNLDRGNGHADG